MHLDDRVHIMNFLQTSKLCMKDKIIAPSCETFYTYLGGLICQHTIRFYYQWGAKLRQFFWIKFLHHNCNILFKVFILTVISFIS